MGWGEGGGLFQLGNPTGRGVQAVLEIQVDGGGWKNHAFCRGVVDFFWNNPLLYSLIVVLITLHISVLPSLLFNNKYMYSWKLHVYPLYVLN